jgi:hypothetical protein
MPNPPVLVAFPESARIESEPQLQEHANGENEKAAHENEKAAHKERLFAARRLRNAT